MIRPAHLVERQGKVQGRAAGVVWGLSMRAQGTPLLLVQDVLLLLQDGVQRLATRGLALLTLVLLAALGVLRILLLAELLLLLLLLMEEGAESLLLLMVLDCGGGLSTCGPLLLADEGVEGLHLRRLGAGVRCSAAALLRQVAAVVAVQQHRQTLWRDSCDVRLLCAGVSVEQSRQQLGRDTGVAACGVQQGRQCVGRSDRRSDGRRHCIGTQAQAAVIVRLGKVSHLVIQITCGDLECAL